MRSATRSDRDFTDIGGSVLVTLLLFSSGLEQGLPGVLAESSGVAVPSLQTWSLSCLATYQACCRYHQRVIPMSQTARLT